MGQKHPRWGVHWYLLYKQNAFCRILFWSILGPFWSQFRNGSIPLEEMVPGMVILAGGSAKNNSTGIHRIPQEWPDSGRNHRGMIKTSMYVAFQHWYVMYRCTADISYFFFELMNSFSMRRCVSLIRQLLSWVDRIYVLGSELTFPSESLK